MNLSIQNCKITGYAKGIATLPDTVVGRAAELKALFDARTDGEVKMQHNALCDACAVLETDVAKKPSTEEMNAAIAQAVDFRVTEIGSSDMMQAVYDPRHRHGDVFAAVEAAGARNYLDNWDFRAGSVVNQRGASGTISTAGYFVDRWKLVSGTATITAAGIALNGTMVQLRETALGLPFTASGIMASGTGTFVYSDAAKTFTVTSAGGTVSRVKLELGGVSTLEADAPMNQGAALTKCMRYFYRFYGTLYGIKFQEGVGNWIAQDFFPVTMRTNPTVTYTDQFNNGIKLLGATQSTVTFILQGGDKTTGFGVTNIKASADL